MSTSTNLVPESVSLSVLSKRIDNEGSTPQFRYRLQLTNEGRSMEFDYSGGYMAFLDHEKAKRRMKSGLWGQDQDNLMYVLSRGSKPNPNVLQIIFECSAPKIEQVLHSLILDASCGNDTFEDFCANCGYDTDSRKALDAYMACQKIGSDLRRVLGSKYPEIEEALADY